MNRLFHIKLCVFLMLNKILEVRNSSVWGEFLTYDMLPHIKENLSCKPIIFKHPVKTIF